MTSGGFRIVSDTLVLYVTPECTWCMKNSQLSTSIWSIATGSTVPSTLRRYAPDCVDRDTQTPLYHAPVEMSFITHAAAKILKIATYVFIIMDFLGATAP